MSVVNWIVLIQANLSMNAIGSMQIGYMEPIFLMDQVNNIMKELAKRTYRPNRNTIASDNN